MPSVKFSSIFAVSQTPLFGGTSSLSLSISSPIIQRSLIAIIKSNQFLRLEVSFFRSPGHLLLFTPVFRLNYAEKNRIEEID